MLDNACLNADLRLFKYSQGAAAQKHLADMMPAQIMISEHKGCLIGVLPSKITVATST